ncbi:MAG: hypothetical protein VX871_06775 [Pseudomonadota bacterium]|nr:hypothetical protein [Pseudomonadota bacterium]
MTASVRAWRFPAVVLAAAVMIAWAWCPSARAQSDAAEIEFWQSVKNSTAAAELEAYLKAYPNGQFAPLAKLRIDKLRGGAAPTAAPGSTAVPAGKPPASPPPQLAAASAPPVHDCDRLAAHPGDPDRKAEGVLMENIDAGRARPACEKALAEYPETSRFAFQLGRALERSKSYAQAFRQYREAVDKGHAGALANLGGLYEAGLGVAKDVAQAERWYRKAAEKGISAAMTGLGFMYAHGRGVRQDAAEAVRWFRRAAEKGEPPGMFNLGHMYAHGIGVKKDVAEAVRWYHNAAAAGFEKANLELKGLGYAPVPKAPAAAVPAPAASGASDLGDLGDLGALGKLN